MAFVPLCDKGLLYTEADAESKELRVRKTRRWISREEETVIRGMDGCPVAAKWRYHCVAEGTIFAAHPDCSVVIGVSKTNVHRCPKKEVL